MGHAETRIESMSPASSVDNEASNTTFTHVHFGPIQSPEKRFIESRREILDLTLERLEPPQETLIASSDAPPDGSEPCGNQEEDLEHGLFGSPPGTPDIDHFAADGAFLLLFLPFTSLISSECQNHLQHSPAESSALAITHHLLPRDHRLG